MNYLTLVSFLFSQILDTIIYVLHALALGTILEFYFYFITFQWQINGFMYSKSYAYILDHRLGFIVDFLSHATIVGFMAGAATVVCLQQLKGILGLDHFTHGTDLVSVMRSVFSQTHQVASALLD